MNIRPTLTKLTTHKKATVIFAAFMLIVVFLSGVVYLNRNYLIDRFMPRSRVDFVIYSPDSGTQLKTGLTIPHYLENTPRSPQERHAIVTLLDNKLQGWYIKEQRAIDFQYKCPREVNGECEVKHTTRGQAYLHTIKRSGTGEDATLEEWIVFNKEGTEISLHRNIAAYQADSEVELNNYVDSFGKMPDSGLYFHFVSGKIEPLGI